MKQTIFLLVVLIISSQIDAQVKAVDLPEVVISAVNYKYLNAVNSEETAISVQMLQEKVAMFDLKNSELYNDEYDTYYVSFYIPEGTILAAYDENGRLLRTIERFENVRLPEHVKNVVVERFPNWVFQSDVYKVNFRGTNAKIQYKVRLKNGDKTIRIKLDNEGNFI